MRIDYNILWFENDEGWLKQAVKGISNLLEDYGFRLNETTQKDGSKIDELISKIQSKTLDVDMIFMDFKLSGEINGEKIIETIRKRNLFTEILFYSQDSNVKQIIEETYGSIEGIYYGGRDNFRDKAREVIWHTIKKVEDVESMRGLIMGATSEIENLMKDITLEYIANCGDDIKNIIAKPIFEEVGKNVREKFDRHSEYEPTLNLKKLIKDNTLFDANKKAHAIQAIINELRHPDLEGLTGTVFYDSISNIFLVRNKFGHCKVIINDDGIRVLQSPPPIEEFTDENCIEIRKN
ncbi:MAG: response regulator [Sphingobacteriales bacterium JAD_PAG50586_3]|nr:MAG: response regulator [Sphingobacteriales bacterium JAD_PAG50586_3]